MFIPRALSSVTETSITTSSHSLNSSSSGPSEPSSNKAVSSEAIKSTSDSTTSSQSATFTSVLSASRSEVESSSSEVASFTSTFESFSSSSSPATSDPVKTTMTTTTQPPSSTASKEPTSSDGGVTSPLTSSASTASISGVRQALPSTSSGASPTSSGATKSSHKHSTSTARALSAAVTKSKKLTSTNTTTDPPSSTFSTPVAVTITNSSNGEITTTAPPLVTSIGASMDADGSTIAYTQVIANPTGLPNNSSVRQSSFLRKRGQVIGTFLAVGVIFVALIGYAIWLLHRRQRRKRSEHGRASFNWSPASDYRVSVINLPEAPPMRTIFIDLHKKPSVEWSPRPLFPEDLSLAGPSQPVPAYAPNEPRGVGLAIVRPGGNSVDKDVGPFSDHHAAPDSAESITGLAITTGQDAVRMRTSITPSSPSLYSESMKSVNDADSLYEREMGISQDGCETPRYVPPPLPTYTDFGSASTSPHAELPTVQRSVDQGPRMILQIVNR